MYLLLCIPKKFPSETNPYFISYQFYVGQTVEKILSDAEHQYKFATNIAKNEPTSHIMQGCVIVWKALQVDTLIFLLQSLSILFLYLLYRANPQNCSIINCIGRLMMESSIS